MLTWMRRLLIASAGLVLVALLVGPWVLYEVALSNVVGRPSLPSTIPVSSSDAEAVWRKLRERGPVTVEPLSPHGYILALLTKDTLPPGAHVAWWIARNHNRENLKDQRMIWWHLSGAALTVWLTRHWSTDQLVAKAHEIFRSGQPASNPRMQRTRESVADAPLSRAADRERWVSQDA